MSRLSAVHIASKLRRVALAVPLALLVLVAPVFAQSALASSTVGQLFTPTYEGCSAGTFVQTGVAAGNSYVIPQNGAITSWSFQTNAQVVPNLELEVAKPTGVENEYTVVAQSAAGTETANTVNTYTAHVPVEAGEIIGIYENGGGCISATNEASDTYAWILNEDVPTGSTSIWESLSGDRIPLSATLSLAPTATTGAASGVSTKAAMLSGSVGAEESRTAFFEYGTSTTYGSSTTHQNIGTSATETSVSATLSGLAPGTTYHYRLVAEDAGGVTHGADQTFTTDAEPAPPVKAPEPPPTTTPTPTPTTPTTTPTVTPPPKVAPVIAIEAGKRLKARKGKPKAALACKHAPCKGIIKLVNVVKVKVKRKGKTFTRRKTVVLGRADYTIAAGKRHTHQARQKDGREAEKAPQAARKADRHRQARQAANQDREDQLSRGRSCAGAMPRLRAVRVGGRRFARPRRARRRGWTAACASRRRAAGG